MGWLISTFHQIPVEPRVAGMGLSMEEKVRLAHINRMHEAKAIRRNKAKVKQALVDQYRNGVIDSDTFLQLAARMEEITDDLMALGNSTGVVLGKKYVCGLIDRDDFEKMKFDLVPAYKEDEEKYVQEEFKKRKERLIAFKHNLGHDRHVCQKCHKDDTFVSPLREYDDMVLCKSCYELYEHNKYFSGFEGRYITCEPCEIDLHSEPVCTDVTS